MERRDEEEEEEETRAESNMKQVGGRVGRREKKWCEVCKFRGEIEEEGWKWCLGMGEEEVRGGECRNRSVMVPVQRKRREGREGRKGGRDRRRVGTQNWPLMES